MYLLESECIVISLKYNNTTKLYLNANKKKKPSLFLLWAHLVTYKFHNAT